MILVFDVRLVGPGDRPDPRCQGGSARHCLCVLGRLSCRGLLVRFHDGGAVLRVEIRPRERRWLWKVLGHGRESGGILDGEQLFEDLAHLGFEAGDPRLNSLDLALEVPGVDLQVLLELGLPGNDALLGLLADPRNLGLRPVPDAADVIVGLLAELVDVRCRAAVDLLDERLGIGLVVADRGRAGGLGRRVHGPVQVGQEGVGATSPVRSGAEGRGLGPCKGGLSSVSPLAGLGRG